mmetsp:Transcript_17583/g.45302  ORF Transcript_17583/g.45302 Transcript_17583/m.45302 type:complete len:486 (+) Transcript_17583:75-1532(+)
MVQAVATDADRHGSHSRGDQGARHGGRRGRLLHRRRLRRRLAAAPDVRRVQRLALEEGLGEPLRPRVARVAGVDRRHKAVAGLVVARALGDVAEGGACGRIAHEPLYEVPHLLLDARRRGEVGVGGERVPVALDHLVVVARNVQQLDSPRILPQHVGDRREAAPVEGGERHHAGRVELREVVPAAGVRGPLHLAPEVLEDLRPRQDVHRGVSHHTDLGGREHVRGGGGPRHPAHGRAGGADQRHALQVRARLLDRPHQEHVAGASGVVGDLVAPVGDLVVSEARVSRAAREEEADLAFQRPAGAVREVADLELPEHAERNGEPRGEQRVEGVHRAARNGGRGNVALHDLQQVQPHVELLVRAAVLVEADGPAHALDPDLCRGVDRARGDDAVVHRVPLAALLARQGQQVDAVQRERRDVGQHELARRRRRCGEHPQQQERGRARRRRRARHRPRHGAAAMWGLEVRMGWAPAVLSQPGGLSHKSA